MSGIYTTGCNVDWCERAPGHDGPCSRECESCHSTIEAQDDGGETWCMCVTLCRCDECGEDYDAAAGAHECEPEGDDA